MPSIEFFGDLARVNGTPCVRCIARKISRCALSGKAIHSGDAIYRPLTNGADRMTRYLASVIEHASPAPAEPPIRGNARTYVPQPDAPLRAPSVSAVCSLCGGTRRIVEDFAGMPVTSVCPICSRSPAKSEK